MTESSLQTDYDIVIVGGGLIGASLAIALSPLPLKIAVVEAVEQNDKHQPSFDDRSVALSSGSIEILKTINAWDAIKHSATPIQHIHVSDKGHMGICRIHAGDYHRDALGYVIENREIGRGLYQRLKSLSNVSVISPATVNDITQNECTASVTIQKDASTTELATHLVVAADGTFSNVAQILAMEKQTRSYNQIALIANIQTSKPMEGWAYERFTSSGPIAFLPLSRQRISVVWTFEPSQESEMRNKSNEQLIGELQNAFGYRCGKITQIGQTSIFPLAQQTLTTGFNRHVAFIGNALHTGHPVAGQGFNLGLRDLAALTEILAFACYHDIALNDSRLLALYWQKRQDDIDSTLSMTDGLARLFAHDSLLVSAGRNASLKWMDVLNPAKQWFANKAMGKRTDLSTIARGIPVDALKMHPLPEELRFGEKV